MTQPNDPPVILPPLVSEAAATGDLCVGFSAIKVIDGIEGGGRLGTLRTLYEDIEPRLHSWSVASKPVHPRTLSPLDLCSRMALVGWMRRG